MRNRKTPIFIATALLLSMVALAQTKGKAHLNPMVDLLQAGKPVFGIYAPSARNLPNAPAPAPRGGGARGNAPLTAAPTQEDPCGDATKMAKNPPAVPTMSAAEIKQQTEIAKLTLAHPMDYLFSGDFEDTDVKVPLQRWTEYLKGMQAVGGANRLKYPLMLKANKAGCDLSAVVVNVSTELNMGAVGIMFPHTASAKELTAALAAMRFKSKGGTRPDNVGMAPAYWGLSEKDYKDKADLSALNPNGELISFAVVEDKDGLANRREIAQVKGLSVLWPGAGTLRNVFYKKEANGNFVPDTAAWEAAIQSVVDACKEFKVACGFPANNVQDMELRRKQGFSVFVSSWGDAAFSVVETGRKTQ